MIKMREYYKLKPVEDFEAVAAAMHSAVAVAVVAASSLPFVAQRLVGPKPVDVVGT